MRTQGKKLCCVPTNPRGAFPVYLARLASGGGAVGEFTLEGVSHVTLFLWF